MNIYACSDIHGQYGLFQKMLKDIRFSDDDLLYIVGDVIDRGPESIPMLLDIMSREHELPVPGKGKLLAAQFEWRDRHTERFQQRV